MLISSAILTLNQTFNWKSDDHHRSVMSDATVALWWTGVSYLNWDVYHMQYLPQLPVSFYSTHLCLPACYMLRSREKCQVPSAWDMPLWYSSACVTMTQPQLRTASSLVTNLILPDSFHIISTSSPSGEKGSCESGVNQKQPVVDMWIPQMTLVVFSERNRYD